MNISSDETATQKRKQRERPAVAHCIEKDMRIGIEESFKAKEYRTYRLSKHGEEGIPGGLDQMSPLQKHEFRSSGKFDGESCLCNGTPVDRLVLNMGQEEEMKSRTARRMMQRDEAMIGRT